MFENVDRNDKFLTLNGVQSDLFHSVLEDTDEYHTLKVNKFDLILVGRFVSNTLWFDS